MTSHTFYLKKKINMMKCVVLTIILSLLFLTLHSQDDNCNCNYYPVRKDLLNDKIVSIVLPAGDVRLPPNELYNQWNYGDILLNNGKVVTNQFIRYDGLHDQLILGSKNPDQKLVVEKYTIQGFDIGTINSDLKLRYRRISIREKYTTENHDAFLQILVSGKINLYAYRKLIKSNLPNKIENNYSYFIRKEDGSMINFYRLSRQKILIMFPEKSELYRTQLRKSHLRVRDEAGLIKAIELLNRL
jgi:hypothetical protein